MAGPFGLDVALAGIVTPRLESGLARLGAPPDWLTAVEDPHRLRADLERAVPELASGAVRLTAARFKRARMEGGSWTAVCRLRLDGPLGGDRREIDVEGRLVPPGEDAPASAGDGELGSEGWHRFLPDLRLDLGTRSPDAGLPALAVLTDPAPSRSFLEGALRGAGGGLGDLELTSCTPTVMRHKEGRRCTVRYRLEYDPVRRRSGWPDGVVAKAYQGDEGRTAYEGMRALWMSPLRTSSVVRIAQPLALLPEMKVVVQGLVPGERSLKGQIAPAFAAGIAAGVESLTGLVYEVGRGLAELHASGATAGQTVTWDSELAAVRRGFDELGAAAPAVSGAMQPLLSGLAEFAADVPAGPLVATHRSFRPAQVLVDGDDIAFIDFDAFCQAEAGLDIALFRNTLCDLCLRALEERRDGPLDEPERRASLRAPDELCATFLAGYEEVAELSTPRLALWDALTGARDILDCWRKIKFEHLERRMELLRRQLGLEPVAAESFGPLSTGPDVAPSAGS
jgi:hypothetical protein